MNFFLSKLFDEFREFYESWRSDPNRKHDERLGQRLYNELRKDIPKARAGGFTGHDTFSEIEILVEKQIIADKLWNMTDKDFIAYLERFFE